MPTPQSARRWAVLAIVIAGLVAASLAGIKMNSQSQAPAPKAAGGPVVIEAEPVRVAELLDAVTAVGTLRSAESVVLKSEIPGRIARVMFADGSQVAKGDALIVFDASVQQALVNQARAERDLAAAKLKRTEELFQKKFLSAAALDDAKATEEIAAAKLALAQANLDKMTIRAPFAGQIGIRQVSVGDYLKEGVELVNLEDLSSMKADFRVPEQISGRLAVGQTVQLQSDAFAGASFPAKVVAIDPAVDASGRSLLLRAELRDVSRRLKPGMFVRVRLVLESRPNAIVIPEEALVTAQNRLTVFKVVEGKAVATPVVTGLRSQLDQRAVVEVIKGLAPDDVVVTAGQIKIRGNNVPVKVAEPAPAKGPGGPPEKSPAKKAP
ncbi:MAG: efflux RND transporter periplasmic adaptor subunit [Betaproteobacteria bacterium]|jgi:membrane fusion protein (multidrug efflux system)